MKTINKQQKKTYKTSTEKANKNLPEPSPNSTTVCSLPIRNRRQLGNIFVPISLPATSHFRTHDMVEFMAKMVHVMIKLLKTES